jgi:hypothetical protein
MTAILFFIKHHPMKAYRSGSITPRPFYSRGKYAGTHWMILRAALDAMAKRRNSFPFRKMGPNSPARGLVAVLTELLLRNQHVGPLSL